MLPPAPPACATTAVTVGALGKTCVQVAPRSWLTATPQSVATTTSLVPGANEIPQPLNRELHRGPAGGLAVAGFCHVAPPSVLRQIPPPLMGRLSPHADAMRMLALPGSYLMSDIRNGGSESMWDQVAPPSTVLYRPPLSLATMATLVLDGLTSTATARPPHLILG